MDDTSKLTEKEIIRAERNSGIVSGKLREIQVRLHVHIFSETSIFLLTFRGGKTGGLGDRSNVRPDTFFVQSVLAVPKIKSYRIKYDYRL